MKRRFFCFGSLAALLPLGMKKEPVDVMEVGNKLSAEEMSRIALEESRRVQRELEENKYNRGGYAQHASIRNRKYLWKNVDVELPEMVRGSVCWQWSCKVWVVRLGDPKYDFHEASLVLTRGLVLTANRKLLDEETAFWIEGDHFAKKGVVSLSYGLSSVTHWAHRIRSDAGERKLLQLAAKRKMMGYEKY